MKNIVILGDSFTFGQGCEDRLWYWDNNTRKFIGDPTLCNQGPSKHCWASLLAKDYPEYDVINLAKSGIDNISLSSWAQNTINEDTELVIYSMAPSDRIKIKHPEDDTAINWSLAFLDEAEPTYYSVAKKMFITHLYHPDVFKQITVNCALSVYASTLRYGAKFMIALQEDHAFTTISNTMMHINNDHKIDNLARLTHDVYPPEFAAIDKHANELGHLHYYETVIKPVIKTYL